MKAPGGGRIPTRDFLKRVYEGLDPVSDYSAQVAYYLLFSLFPLLFFLVALAPYLPLGSAVDTSMDRLRSFLPGQAASLVENELVSLTKQTRPKLLTLGILAAIWSASRAAAAIGTALNHAYGVPESRPYWRVQLSAVMVTVAGALLSLLSIAALLAGSSLGLWLSQKLGVGTVYHIAIEWLRWPVTALVVALAAALAYYFLPDVKQKFKFLTPGSAAATLLWMLLTWSFGLYVSHFGDYNATYGSIGGVIVLLTFFYISAFIFLLGGRINAVLESSSEAGKKLGEHAPGENQQR